MKIGSKIEGDMKQISRLFTVCTLITLAIPLTISARANAASIFQLEGVEPSDRPAVLNFLATVESKLPPAIRYAMSHDIIQGSNYNRRSYPLIVDFGWIPDESIDVVPPLCDAVDRMDKAQLRKSEWQQAVQRNAMDGGVTAIRFDGETQVQVVKGRHSTAYGEKITLNWNLLPAILRGPSATPDFNCGHRTYYRLAQASLIYGIARIYDNIGLIATQQEIDNNDENDTDYGGSARSVPRTLVSETIRYRNLSYGWTGEPGDYKTVLAYWPRAVSPYEYASDVRAHFAFNLEYYLLDPEYQCRKPLLYHYFNRIFGADPAHPFTPRYDTPSTCQVNTKIFLQFLNQMSQKKLTFYVGNGLTDINPDLVRRVDYYRASVGNDASEMFGHAMYKLSVCGPMSTSRTCDRNKMFDLIINPRANPLQMKLDNLKGVFGGYPSQFFISRYLDIFNEYGNDELRSLFSFPLGHTIDNQFVHLNNAEKTNFIYATLELYWEYIGDYKFISNNCADEILRLYKTAFDNPDINHAQIYTPKGVSKLFAKYGIINKNLANAVIEPIPILSQIPIIGRLFWNTKKEREQEKQIESDPQHIDKGLLFAVRGQIADIYRREHNGHVATQGDIDQEMRRWADLATVSDKASEFCKNSQEYSSRQVQIARMRKRVTELNTQYQTLYNAAKARFEAGDASAHQDMAAINQDFLTVVSYMRDKRDDDFDKVAIQLAYDIAQPRNGQQKLCDGNGGFTVTPKMKSALNSALANYSRVQYELMPFDSKFGAEPGYGIPLYGEMLQTTAAGREKLREATAEEIRSVVAIRLEVVPNMGMDWYLLKDLNNEYKSLINDNCHDKLITFAGSDPLCSGN